MAGKKDRIHNVSRDETDPERKLKLELADAVLDAVADIVREHGLEQGFAELLRSIACDPDCSQMARDRAAEMLIELAEAARHE